MKALVLTVIMLFCTKLTFASNVIHCKESGIETYIGTVDVDYVLNLSDKNYSSVLTMASGGKILKVIKQNSYYKWTTVDASRFFSQGNAVEFGSDGKELEIPGSETAFQVWTGPQYGGLVQFTFYLSNKEDAAVYFDTRNCTY